MFIYSFYSSFHFETPATFLHTSSWLFLRSRSTSTFPCFPRRNRIRPSTPSRKNMPATSGISSSFGPSPRCRNRCPLLARRSTSCRGQLIRSEIVGECSRIYIPSGWIGIITKNLSSDDLPRPVAPHPGVSCVITHHQFLSKNVLPRLHVVAQDCDTIFNVALRLLDGDGPRITMG